MPSQKGVGRHDRREIAQGAAPQPVRADGKPSPFIVGQPESPSTQLLSKDPILFREVGDRILLPVASPAGQRPEHDPREGDIEHGGSL